MSKPSRRSASQTASEVDGAAWCGGLAIFGNTQDPSFPWWEGGNSGAENSEAGRVERLRVRPLLIEARIDPVWNLIGRWNEDRRRRGPFSPPFRQTGLAFFCLL